MTRAAPSVLALVLGVAAAIALASCGGGSDAKLLPGRTAQEITKNLAQVRELAAEGECVSAEDAALQISTQVEELRGIDPQLKQALQDGATKLNEVVLTCAEEEAEETTEESLPTTTETTTRPEKEKKPAKEKHEPPGHAKPETGESSEETTPSGPPYGEAKGHEKEPQEGGGPPSGGIGPGSEAEGGN
jgi:hypothetical protein